MVRLIFSITPPACPPKIEPAAEIKSDASAFPPGARPSAIHDEFFKVRQVRRGYKAYF